MNIIIQKGRERKCAQQHWGLVIFTPWYYAHEYTIWQKEIKVTDGMKVADQLTLKEGDFPGGDYPRGPSVIVWVP